MRHGRQRRFAGDALLLQFKRRTLRPPRPRTTPVFECRRRNHPPRQPPQRRRNQSPLTVMKNKLITNTSKLLFLALVAGLFAGCAATRPISDVALGAGGAYLGLEISNG